MKVYLIEHHRRVFDAVVAGDPEAAESILREHFAIGDDYRRRAAIGEIGRPGAATSVAKDGPA
jgi:DNA-binding GntR family transcriptional regulator